MFSSATVLFFCAKAMFRERERESALAKGREMKSGRMVNILRTENSILEVEIELYDFIKRDREKGIKETTGREKQIKERGSERERGRGTERKGDGDWEKWCIL